MPEVLKVLLVDDWQAVTKHNQVGKIFYFSNLQLHTYFSPLLYTARNVTTKSKCRRTPGRIC